MIRIGILGDIGSGKTYVANSFGYPVFNADKEVEKLYQENKKVFEKLNKILPLYVCSFPIKKIEIINAILANKKNLKKIVKIVHLEIRKKLNIFLKKNRNKKIIILDIPLLLENKIYSKKDILIFVQAHKKNILKRLTKRKNFNKKLLYNFKKIQLPLDIKKKKSKFVIKNNFRKKSVKISINRILNEIL
ncbi:dephospho-CoA kinase [Candidatus Pelagibacter sp.]|nr:dephospho-CoA kinase [Candidatus Pelagibacter sp.]